MKKIYCLLLIVISITCSSQVLLPGTIASSIQTSSTLTNGLVSYWKFEETTGTTAYDDYGSTDLTNSGATINQTVGGKVCYQFAPNDYVGNIDAFEYTTAFSISLMIYTSSTTGYESPIGNYHWDGNGYDLIREQTTGYLYWALRNSTTGSVEVEGTTNIANSAWHHVVLQYDGSYARMWVDGTAATAVAYANTIGYTTSNRFIIGTREYDDNHWTGYIKNVCIYNRAINSSEVSQLNTNGGKPY